MAKAKPKNKPYIIIKDYMTYSTMRGVFDSITKYKGSDYFKELSPHEVQLVETFMAFNQGCHHLVVQGVFIKDNSFELLLEDNEIIEVRSS